MTTIRIGFEVPSGEKVEVPLQHIAVYGLTRQAGKTTALEGMVARLDTTALVIRTGKNDLTFDWAHRVRPFFRERYDWRYVERMLWSFLSEKPKVYRTWLMRSTQGARSLADVHRNLQNAATRKGLRGWDADMLYQLDHYFAEILPALRELDLATSLDLERDKVNVMDLENVTKSVQQLIVAAVLDRLMEHPQHVVVVLPEARNFIPSATATPATRSADDFVREGAKLGMFLWVDSQSLTGVDQQVIRNFGLSLHGRQTSDLEIDRIVKAIGAGVSKATIKKLGLGEFLLEDKDGVRKVYAQPAWVSEVYARCVAKGEMPDYARHAEEQREAWSRHHKPKEDPKVDEKERKKYEDEAVRLHNYIADIEGQMLDLKKQVKAEHDRAEANAKVAADYAVERIVTGPVLTGGTASREDVARARIGVGIDPLPATTGTESGAPLGEQRADLHVWVKEPKLTVHVQEVHLEASGDDLRGRIARMVADGYLDERRTIGNIGREILKRGGRDYTGGSQPTLKRELVELADMGFFTRASNTEFVTNPEAKARVRVVKERVSA